VDPEDWERLHAEVREMLHRGLRGKASHRRFEELTELLVQCRDCDRWPEFYMVSQSNWVSAFHPNETPTGALCLNCLERRLGRRLRREEIGDGVGGVFNSNHRLRKSERPVF
jgi:hypothetical protein